MKSQPTAVTARRVTVNVDGERLQRIVLSARLESTRVLSIHARAAPKILAAESFEATSRFGATLLDITRGAAASTVTIMVFFSTASTDNIEGQPLMLVEVQRLLVYSGLPLDAQEAELQALGETTALFNAWPFRRSDVHGLSVQLGLNPVLLPLLRAQPATPPVRSPVPRRVTTAASKRRRK